MGILISEMCEGQKAEGVYLVRNKKLGFTRAGKPFLTLTLGDRSGVLEAKVWNEAEVVSEGLSTGDFVKVTGQVGQYNGRAQLTLETVQRVDEQDAGIDPADFLPVTTKDPNRMMAELMERIDRIRDGDYRELLLKIFRKKGIREKFRTAPASKSMHHAFVGGLLEHTLSLLHLCESVAPHFPEMDHDLLRAGVLLHDIGKVDELSCSRAFDYTDPGRLMGHIVLELERVDEAVRSIPGFPEEKAVLLKHLLASHHGKEEFGSPVKPMTLEALVLHKLDDLDAKTQTFREMMKNAPSGHWSSYHPLLGQFVFKGFDAPVCVQRTGRKGARKETDETKAADEEDPGYPTLF